MNHKLLPHFLIFICLFYLFGCSQKEVNPIVPDSVDDPSPILLNSDSNRAMLGLWRITLDPETQEISVIPDRSSLAHSLISSGIDIQLDYDPWIFPSLSLDWEDRFYHFAVWDIDVTLVNNTGQKLNDVRGICYVQTGGNPGEFIGLHNADGWTTLWTDDQVNFKKNPFIAFNSIPISLSSEKKRFELLFNDPLPPAVECDKFRHRPATPAYYEWIDGNPGYGADHLDEFFVDAPGNQFECLFAVDATIDDYCQEPYAFKDFNQSVVDIAPNSFGMFSFTVEDHQDDISISEFEFSTENYHTGLPLNGFTVLSTSGTGGMFTTFFTHGGIDREAMYKLTITATSTNPTELQADPYNNPRRTSQVYTLRIGDFNNLVGEIFEPPTTSLINEVKADWASRDLSPDTLTIEASSTMGGFPSYYMLSHQMNYGTHYGFVRIPAGNWGENELPIMLYTHPGDWVSREGCRDQFYQDYKDQFIEIIPSYRGNYACWGTQLFQSDGEKIIGDWEIDDALTFLYSVINDSNFNMADPSRVVVMGGSRGGAPALLSKIRDSYQPTPIIDGAIVIYGTGTDFFMGEMKREVDRYIHFYPGYFSEPQPFNEFEHYYNEDYLLFEFGIEAYLEGDYASVHDLRLRMLRSSALHFVEQGELLNIQVHHGIMDVLVRDEHSRHLEQKLIETYGSGFEFYYYDLPYPAHCPAANSYPVEPMVPLNYEQLIEQFLDGIIN